MLIYYRILVFVGGSKGQENRISCLKISFVFVFNKCVMLPQRQKRRRWSYIYIAIAIRHAFSRR